MLTIFASGTFWCCDGRGWTCSLLFRMLLAVCRTCRTCFSCFKCFSCFSCFKCFSCNVCSRCALLADLEARGGPPGSSDAIDFWENVSDFTTQFFWKWVSLFWHFPKVSMRWFVRWSIWLLDSIFFIHSFCVVGKRKEELSWLVDDLDEQSYLSVMNAYPAMSVSSAGRGQAPEALT